MSLRKRIVVALGGNALGNSLSEQRVMIKEAARAIADLAVDNDIAIVHGNGPQVGMIHTAFETAAMADSSFYPLPMPVCVALSQGYIGYDLQHRLNHEFELRNQKKNIASIITQVIVDENDPAFNKPTKPIGRFMTEEEGKKLKEKGLHVIEDSGRGYRQVVASPSPIDIIEKETVELMLSHGHIPIIGGGGGIPVVKKEEGYEEISAVIDKDLTAAKLAELINGDMLIILTAVEKVAVNFGKENQEWIDRMSLEEAKRLINENHFAPGSMLPKIKAAVSFVENKRGSKVLITLLSKARDGIEGRTGTIIY